MSFRSILHRIAWHITPLAAAISCVFVFKYVDQSFEVVKDFRITNQSLTPYGVLIEGSMNKERNCTFKEVVAYTSGGAQIPVKFLDKPQGYPDTTRAVRVQMWGPWELVSGNAQTIYLYAHHSCHILWPHSQLLTKFTVVRVEETDGRNLNAPR